METKQVYWKNKFDGRQVIINASSLDPAIHSEEPWEDIETTDPKADRVKALGAMSAEDVKAELAKVVKDAEYTSKPKAIVAIIAAEYPE